MAELANDARSCRVCGVTVTRPDHVDPPTEVISLDRPRPQTDQVDTDSRLDLWAQLSAEPEPSSSAIPQPTVRIDFPTPPPPPRPSIAPAPLSVPPGRSPFAALISEAMGLEAREISEVSAISEVVRIELEEIRAEELLVPIEAGALEFDLVTGEPIKHRGGKSIGELEGWLDSGYERPISEVRPLPQLRGSVPLRGSQPPPRGSQPPPPPRKRPSGPPPGPPPLRIDQLPLADPDRHVRRAAELVQNALESIADNKLSVARNHLKLALEFGRDNAAYRGLEAYILELESHRDPHLEILERKAIKHENEGALDLAVEVLREAVNTSDEPQLLERLGLLIGVKQKRPEVGIRFLERALKLRPQSKDYQHSYDRLKKLMSAADPDKAAKKKGKKTGKKS